MYVAIANSRRTPAMVSTTTRIRRRQVSGRKWSVDLKAFADQGVDLTNVDKISIGFGDNYNPQTGGSGLVFFDDIRLYRPPEQ